MKLINNRILIAAILGVTAAVISSCSKSDGNSEAPVYRMTYTDISKATRGFHTRALASPDPDLYGEGCVRKISAEQAQRFNRALRIGQARRDESITVDDTSVMTISDNSGRFSGPLSLSMTRDFEGNIYDTPREKNLEIYRMGLQILLDNGCEDARYRLDIAPYK